jgi:hypothetical protein
MKSKAIYLEGWKQEVENKWQGQIEEVDRQISEVTQIELKYIVQIKMWKKII